VGHVHHLALLDAGGQEIYSWFRNGVPVQIVCGANNVLQDKSSSCYNWNHYTIKKESAHN
jgi:hypothetical protein